MDIEKEYKKVNSKDALRKTDYCPCCNHSQLSIFYEVYQVPVHSCLMLDSQEEALSFPCEDVILAFCNHCGFITNLVFEPRWSAYAENYEDQQSFSPTFNKFALKIAENLISRYQLHNKDIVEIGCSKGDFLILLCELGNNRGIGIDPSVLPGRIESEAAARVEFISEYYSLEHSRYKKDLLCCRHTLEHIHPAYQFLSTVRKSIEKLDTPVFFEIPDTIRVLKAAAFEDIYYEHCSYFTPGSLASLFRSCEFSIEDIYLDYNDQYLLIEAASADYESTIRHPLEENIEQLTHYVKEFQVLIEKKLNWWRKNLQLWYENGDKVIIWGSGSKCVAFMTTLHVSDQIEYVVDINPHRHGKFIPGVGKEIKSPEFLRKSKPDRIIIMNAIYREEIQDIACKLGIASEMIALGDEHEYL
ncbi:MAG: class I SAM-dependent methyltransferase [Cyanobacteria bacterium P01_E01_bin.6]